MKKCKNLVLLASCLAVSAITVGVAKLSFRTANAEPVFTGEQTIYVDDSGKIYATETENAVKIDFKMEMVYGASVRIVEGEGNGLRFATHVNANAYDALSPAVVAGNVSMGTLIGPTYLVGDQLTFDDNAESYQNVIQTEKGWNSNVNNGNYTYYSAIYSVPTAVLNMNFSAQSYAEFKLANGEKVVLYAKNAEKETGDTQNSNVRSVKYIADKALTDTSATLTEPQKAILTDLQEMKEDGVVFNAPVTGATAAETDRDGAYGSVYTATFNGSNALTFNGANYHEFKAKFNASLTLDDMMPAGKVSLMRNGELVGEAPAGEWVTVIVAGNTFSVNKSVSATVYGVKECTGYWLARTEKYLLNLVGGINASKLTVGTSDNITYYHAPSPVLKKATYNGVEEITFKKPYSEVLGETKTAHTWSYSATNQHYAGPQMHITSAITKAELQALSNAGYTEMSFSYTVSKGVTDNINEDLFYRLDLAKVKTMIDASADMAAARETVQKAVEWNWGNNNNTVIKDYMTGGKEYCCEWKTVTLSVAELIDCYDVLDLLPLFYSSVTYTRNYNVYITDFTFTKQS